MSVSRLIAVVLACGLLGVAAPPQARAATSFPDDLVWLGLGDSYSSGEGLRYVDASANPPGRTCERATGRSSVNGGQGSRAWAAVAYDELRGEMKNSTFALLACTGAISNQIHGQYRDEWTAKGRPRADLVTLSIGGNNLGFSEVLQRCIGVALDNSTGAGFTLNPAIGCDTTEAKLKAAADLLVGTSGKGPDGGQTLRDMYREVAENAVNQGGHVVVLGYPNIVEESGRWSLGLFEGNRCSRIRRSDTAMLRSSTGYLNEQIARLVQEMSGKYRDVAFHWVDVSKIYENEGGRHGLCTGEPWINGITFGLAGPDTGNLAFRVKRSFHPNQKGHDATGKAVADVVRALSWDKLRRVDTRATLPFVKMTQANVGSFASVLRRSGVSFANDGDAACTYIHVSGIDLSSSSVDYMIGHALEPVRGHACGGDSFATMRIVRNGMLVEEADYCECSTEAENAPFYRLLNRYGGSWVEISPQVTGSGWSVWSYENH